MTTVSRRVVVLLALALSTVAGGEPGTPAPERLMAVTIDDLPIAPPGMHTTLEQASITEALLAALRRHRVPAIGFVTENRLEVAGKVEPARVALLRRWLVAGHELGNHGYGHLDLHRVAPETWLEDVIRGERILRPLLAERGQVPRFFRHPFLHTGRSLEIKRRSEDSLAEHGYRVAPVTIDNQEWIFGAAYVEAETDAAARERIGRAYLVYMDAMVSYYEEQARAIVGEELPQVLLIHANALNADWLDPLLSRIEARGYRFIPLERALEHPAFASEDTFVGSSGITWLHRWALTRDLPRSVFAQEPAVPDWLQAGD